MLKKLLSIIIIFAFIVIMMMSIYAETETTSVPAKPEAIVKLTKVEGLKNTLGVQKLDIRINGLNGYKIEKKSNFESVYFEGTEILKVKDITKFKVSTNVLTTYWKWYGSVTKLEVGENIIPLEIKKDKKIFKMEITIVVEYPTPEPTATETPIVTENASPDITETTTDITPEVTEIVTSTPNSSGVEMPDTGETDTAILIIFGIVMFGSAGIFLFLNKIKVKNN